jgi:hypothetical protein
MNDTLQFGYHPDADQIGAFVEHALPAHEREQILDHLANCPECRSIVALSLPPAEEFTPPLPAPVRRRWWSGWMLASPVAVALAALALFAVYVYYPRNTPGRVIPGQVAELHSPATPAASLNAPGHTPQPPSPRPGQHLPDARSTALASRGSLGSVSTMDEQAPAAAAASPTPAALNAGPPPARPDQPAQIAAEKEGALAVEPEPNKVSATISSEQVSNISTQNRNFAALATLGTGTTQAAGQTEASLNESTVSRTPQLKHRLPSGLPVLSMAVHGTLTLAIDTRNSVFLSIDSGKHWRAIPAPWTNKAVLVETVSLEKSVSRPAMGAFRREERSVQPSEPPAASPVQVEATVSSPAPAGSAGSSVTGLVTDQTCAVISGASVAVCNLRTGICQTTKSDRSGSYFIDGLEQGTYSLKVDARGFERFRQEPIAVAASSRTVADGRLTVGSEATTVTVEADALAVQADSNVVSTLIDAHQPAPVFEITTDNLDHWTSADGMTWKRR